MYNEQIEALIEAALADGKITEKEKQILFKRAQSMGIDLDEFEMFLNAKLIQLQKAESSAQKSNKFGDLRKCPACGSLLGSFKMVCPECGYEFHDVESNVYMETFFAKLEEAKKEREMQITSRINKAGILGVFTSVLDQEVMEYSQDRQKVLDEVELSVIKSYPLPRTKEDCVEMLNFILPKVTNAKLSRLTLEWENKYRAILNKLEYESLNNPGFKETLAFFKSQLKERNKLRCWWVGMSSRSKTIWGLVIFYIVFAIVIILLVCLL